MSYCRWSDDDWQCDVYCYEDTGGGWTTHVADNKAQGVPKMPPDVEVGGPEWMKAHEAQLTYLNTAPREPIDKPFAGETFNDDSLLSFRARLVGLRALGYNVPEFVFDRIAEELDEDGDLGPAAA